MDPEDFEIEFEPGVTYTDLLIATAREAEADDDATPEDKRIARAVLLAWGEVRH